MSNVKRTTPREHGSQACYVFGEWGGDSKNGCRCDTCKAGNTTRYFERKARIEPAYVDAGPAREHVAWLSTQGVGLKQIVKVSTVSQGVLWKLMYGKRQPDGTRRASKRILRSTHDAIVAVTPSSGADGSRIPAGPTLAHVDRLVAAGVPRVRIAERIGQTGALQLRGQQVTRHHARAIAEMVAELDAGTLVTVKRHRNGDRHITPDGVDREAVLRDQARREQSRDRQRRHRMGDDYEPAPADDIDEMYLAMAELLERRQDEPWRTEAACRNRPPWVWFPAPDDRKAIAAAKKVCGACFAREPCLQANLDEPDGVFGGLTAAERVSARLAAAA